MAGDDDDSSATGPEMVERMSGIVLAEASASEANRTLTAPVIEAMWETGLMRRFNPVPAGGAEPGFAEMIETWIAMARLDGSFGWIGIANLPSAAATAAFLPDDGFDEVFGTDGERVTMGGQFFPNGTGELVDGGVRLTGSWNFGSGTGHSQYVAAGYMPTKDGELVWASEGIPELRVAILPRDEVTFTDNWYVQGLKGTGSYDYEVHDVHVPDRRTYELFTREPLRGNSLPLRSGMIGITGAGHAAWALGVSRSMLDDVTELAATKVRMGDPSSLADKASFQSGLTHHEAMWRAARLLVLDAAAEVEAGAATDDGVTPMQRADLRVAAVYATDCSREIAQWAHLAAGTTAIREGSRLERAFRDMYTGTQHAFIGEKVATDAARVWLGLEKDPIGL